MKLKDLPIGTYFTLKPYSEPKETQVYIRGAFDRSEKKYCCDKFWDISSCRMLKGDTEVFVEFIF